MVRGNFAIFITHFQATLFILFLFTLLPFQIHNQAYFGKLLIIMQIHLFTRT